MEVVDLLAAIRLKRKEYDKAALLYEAARKSDPYEKKWVEGLARVYLLSKDEAKLEPVLLDLANMDSDNITVRKKLAEAAAAAKKWGDAEKWARQVLYVNVVDPQAHRQLAGALLGLQKYPAAIREFQAAQKLGDKDPELAIGLAEAYLGAGDKGAAKRVLTEALQSRPDFPRAKELLKKAESS
jgi:predicted Zn-dependent protease